MRTDYRYGFYKLKETINELREQKLRLEKIIEKEPQNKEQEIAIKKAKELLEQVNNILASVDGMN